MRFDGKRGVVNSLSVGFPASTPVKVLATLLDCMKVECLVNGVVVGGGQLITLERRSDSHFVWFVLPVGYCIVERDEVTARTTCEPPVPDLVVTVALDISGQIDVPSFVGPFSRN